MDTREWDERYAAEPGLWGAENATVVEALDGARPGHAVDLACGNGRHASWLAGQGWQVDAVDYSATGIEQARRRPDTDHGRIEWRVDDVSTWAPPHQPVDLVLVAYLHLPSLAAVLERALSWLRPSGTLVYLGHARENLEHGVGGPSDPAVLPTIRQLADPLGTARVHRLEHVERETADGTAIDVLAVASPWP